MRRVKYVSFRKELPRQRSGTEALQMMSRDIMKGNGKEMRSEEDRVWASAQLGLRLFTAWHSIFQIKRRVYSKNMCSTLRLKWRLAGYRVPGRPQTIPMQPRNILSECLARSLEPEDYRCVSSGRRSLCIGSLLHIRQFWMCACLNRER